MKRFLFIFIFMIALLCYGCKSISKKNNSKNLKIEKIGVSDTSTVNITGKVFDLYEKFGLEFATVNLKNAENSYVEACGENGMFHFKHISSGKYKITSYFVGYKTLTDSIEFNSGEIIHLKIGLGYD